jgi:hypothetical protein
MRQELDAGLDCLMKGRQFTPNRLLFTNVLRDSLTPESLTQILQGIITSRVAVEETAQALLTTNALVIEVPWEDPGADLDVRMKWSRGFGDLFLSQIKCFADPLIFPM